MVEAGNWPWCEIDRLRVFAVSTFTRLESGTGLPVRGETRYTALKSSGPDLQLRRGLHDHAIGVELGEVLRHLALAHLVVDGGIDVGGRDAEAAGRVAVDDEIGGRGLPTAGRKRRPSARAASAARLTSRGAHSFSSSRSPSDRVYWYWARAGRPPMVMSCMACRITWAPTISASFGRSRLMMSVALAVRPSSRERRAMLIWAWAAPPAL